MLPMVKILTDFPMRGEKGEKLGDEIFKSSGIAGRLPERAPEAICLRHHSPLKPRSPGSFPGRGAQAAAHIQISVR